MLAYLEGKRISVRVPPYRCAVNSETGYGCVVVAVGCLEFFPLE